MRVATPENFRKSWGFSGPTMTIRFGEFELDEGRRQVLRGGEPLHLSAKQFLLLQILVAQRPNAVAKRELYDRLWPSTFVSDVNLPSLIAELRTALGDDARTPRFIRTVHGFGYAFCGETDQAPAGDPRFVASLTGDPWQVRLASGETILGRATIEDGSVSRRHAAVTCDATSCTIRDLESKNGTFLGGVRVCEPRELADGDVVTLGSVRLVFHRAAAGGSTITLGGSGLRKI